MMLFHVLKEMSSPKMKNSKETIWLRESCMSSALETNSLSATRTMHDDGHIVVLQLPFYDKTEPEARA